MKPFRRAPLLIAAAVLAAGAAQAQTIAPLDLRLPDISNAAAPITPLARPAGVADAPTPDLADPLDPHAPTKLQVKTLESEIFAKTAVDTHFANRDDLTGSLGFLCGLQPGHNDSGAAGAYGIDPHGRFVGAKLAFAF